MMLLCSPEQQNDDRTVEEASWLGRKLGTALGRDEGDLWERASLS